jgi:hypothetical protein
MPILKELWTKEISDPELRSTYEYVVNVRGQGSQTQSWWKGVVVITYEREYTINALQSSVWSVRESWLGGL